MSKSTKHNPRRVKQHHNYTVDELARLYEVHRNTVRAWIKDGLPVFAKGRPQLMLGTDVRAYLTSRRQRDKAKCEPGQLYCLRCRQPRRPALDMAEYQCLRPGIGRLVGICPSCTTVMYRVVNEQKIAIAKGSLEVCLPKAEQRLSNSSDPIVNSDFSREAETHA